MKLAIVGSRGLSVDDLEQYVPKFVTEIVTGGAKGIDSCAINYAQNHQINLVTFLPDYRRYGRGAPLKRNVQIIEYADCVLVFWDGQSRGTRFVIDECQRRNRPLHLYIYTDGEWHLRYPTT